MKSAVYNKYLLVILILYFAHPLSAWAAPAASNASVPSAPTAGKAVNAQMPAAQTPVAQSSVAQGLAISAPVPKATVPATPPAMLPEVLGAKAFLEELLVRRVSQELSTVVDRQAFVLGTQLDLEQIPKSDDKDDNKRADAEDTPPDLIFGALNPEEILKRYATAEGNEEIKNTLRNYRIRTVSVSAGLREDLNSEVKAIVEKWLQTRLESEFGKAAKSSVSIIKVVPEKKPPVPSPTPTPSPKKEMLDLLNQFQHLAGQLIIAFALLLGILLWRLLGQKKPAEIAAHVVNESHASGGDGKGGEDGKNPIERQVSSTEMGDESETLRMRKALRGISKRVDEIALKTLKDHERIIRSWCQSGDEGKLKLACFSEAFKSGQGKLPVPIDAMEGLSQTFAEMPRLPMKEKKEILDKVYWDLLLAANLGAEGLEAPFGYVSGINLKLLDQVLIEKNSKMKAMVAFFMPPDLRGRYFEKLDIEVKREILGATLKMNDVSGAEVKSLDEEFKGQVNLTGSQKGLSVDLVLDKLISAMSPIDEIVLLGEMTGTIINEYKRTKPSLAFLSQWPDESLGTLISRMGADEVVSFVRVKEGMRDRVLGLCPPMTAEIATEELARPDKSSVAEKSAHLNVMKDRIRQMVENREIDLETFFSASGGSEQKDAA